jgi:hypothetical protein
VSDDPEQLAKDMHRILFEMKYLLPWGTISQYDSSGGAPPPDSKIPPGVRLNGASEQLPYEYWQLRWNHTFHIPREPESCVLCARGNRRVGAHGRETVYKEAEADLERWRHKPDIQVQGETPIEFEARIVDLLHKGWTVDEVATNCKTTPTLVRKAHANSLVKDAHKAAERFTVEARRNEVQRMKDQRMSNRQIAFVLGCDEITVRRDLTFLSVPSGGVC